MKYWITTHWPPRIDESAHMIHEGVYAPDGRESAVASMRDGDLLLIYETRSGRPEKRKMIDGTYRVIPCHEGREGVVVIARITSNVYEIEESEPTEYDDGTKVWWRYCADTETISSYGFVPRADVLSILGYSENYNLRGFGDYHSGVKEITCDEFDQILNRFKNSRQPEVNALGRKRAQHARDASTEHVGEGDLHKALKEAVAHDPVKMLGEDGLKLVKLEYEFITNDRVDVLLEDRFGRLAVVEIEPDCPPGAMIGAAQCMKYRALIAFETGRSAEEIRALLVATSISSDVKEAANKYLIESKEIAIT